MIPFETTDWAIIPTTKHEGETGVAYWKTIQYEKIRIRFVEYSPGYRADHWCEKGHLVLCVEGEFTSHMKNGSQHHLKKGMSYQTSDDPTNPHLSTSQTGCTLFIVDGDFLNAD